MSNLEGGAEDKVGIKRKINERLGECEICGKEAAKYTCPACEIHTCGLKCIAKHKSDTDCDGIRSKTSYVPLKKFNDLTILNDYRFLEDVSRGVTKYARDKTKRYTRFENDLPIHLHRLRKAVWHRGTKFFFLPEHFSRHRNNTTYFDWKTKRIDWKLQITFLNAEMLTFHEDRCPETMILQDLVNKYINGVTALKSYLQAGISSIDVLIKAEKSEGESRFYKLQLEENLKDNLYDKTIVEYPQLYVLIQNFYISKSEAEKKLEVANKPKNNDFLQLNKEEGEIKISESSSESEEDESNSPDCKLDDSRGGPIPNYRDLIRN